MNIEKSMPWTKDKPSVVVIDNTDKKKYLAIGLLKDQMLKRHKANIPTTLTVLKGAIEFVIQGEYLEFNQFDVYEIPVSVEHEVVGLHKENIFTLIQEKEESYI